MPAPIKWIPDFELANLENPEGEPWLAASPDGRFSLLFFESFVGTPAYTDLEERIYTAAGTEQTAVGTTFSSTTTEHQAASAYLPDGRRVYVWTEEPATGGGDLEDVYAEIRYGNNVVDVARFLVSGGAGRQHDPIVAANSTGFAVAMADTSVASGQLILKFYNIAGTLINTVVAPNAPETVATQNADLYRDVEIVALANGNYVVVWDSQSNTNVFARIYSSGGIALGGVIDVQTGVPDAAFPDVTALADGRFVVTYGEFAAGNVRGRIFQDDGTSNGASFAIGTGMANDTDNQVQTAALLDGRFVTVWKTSAGEIAGQVMFANGTPDGAAFTVNTATAGDQSRPTIATLADGRFAVSWESGAGATPETIITTIFDPREAGMYTSASDLADDWTGSSFADFILMGGGGDAIALGAGNDIALGEAGNDTLNGGDGNDVLDGGTGNDTLTGGAGIDEANYATALGSVVVDLQLAGAQATGASGSDTLSTIENLTGSQYADTLSGDANANTLRGLGGVDTIFGRGGIDYIAGGGGNDILAGGDNPDEIYGEAGNDELYGGNDFFTDILVGGDGNDAIDGASGAGDFDFLYGNLGNDLFFVDTPADLVFEQPGEGTDTVVAEIAGAGYYLYDNIENLTLLANTPFGVGNGLANILTGNTIANYLLGGGGNDLLNGGGGNDVLFGEGGADTFAFSTTTGSDIIGDFQLGVDKIHLTNFGATLNSFGEIQPYFTQAGANGAIQLPGGEVIIIYNVNMASLSATDFIFVRAYSTQSSDLLTALFHLA